MLKLSDCHPSYLVVHDNKQIGNLQGQGDHVPRFAETPQGMLDCWSRPEGLRWLQCYIYVEGSM
ncbi:hypothetical protein KSP39_PZI001451 [Platanthera zijinensis]|uniref:Uncharacterized protein n=1 Tax=Platanthera zijinensis TaxID=2320716 RepID=A0AAP0GGG6_9ASPA